MELKLDTTRGRRLRGDWLIVGVTEDLEQDRHWGLLDSALQGQLTRLRESRDLTGKEGETLTIHDVPGWRRKDSAGGTWTESDGE